MVVLFVRSQVRGERRQARCLSEKAWLKPMPAAAEVWLSGKSTWGEKDGVRYGSPSSATLHWIEGHVHVHV